MVTLTDVQKQAVLDIFLRGNPNYVITILVRCTCFCDAEQISPSFDPLSLSLFGRFQFNPLVHEDYAFNVRNLGCTKFQFRDRNMPMPKVVSQHAKIAETRYSHNMGNTTFSKTLISSIIIPRFQIPSRWIVLLLCSLSRCRQGTLFRSIML